MKLRRESTENGDFSSPTGEFKMRAKVVSLLSVHDPLFGAMLRKMSFPQRSRPTIHDHLPQILPWLLIALVAIVLIYFSNRPVEVFASNEELQRFKIEAGIPFDQNIILLVTQWCPACKALEHSLNERGVPFSALDVESSMEGSKLYSICLSRGALASVPKIIYEREMISQADLFKRLVIQRTFNQGSIPGRHR